MGSVDKTCLTCKAKYTSEFEVKCDKCEKPFHCCAVDKTTQSISLCRSLKMVIKTIPGAKWFCNNCDSFINEGIDKLTNMQQILNTIVESVNDLNNVVKEQKLGCSKNCEQKLSYAETLKVKETEIVVTPKNKESSRSETIGRIKNVIDLEINKVSGLKNAADNGVKIATTADDESDVIRTLKDNLEQSFEISVPATKHPRMKVIFYDRVMENLNDEQIESALKAQNKELLDESEHFKLIKAIKDKKIETKKTLIIEVNSELFKKVMAKGHLMIRWCRCKVFDALQIPRCYKCARLNHFEKDCKEKSSSCPKCAGDHKINECDSEEKKCVNCIDANAKFKLSLDVNHSAWDKSCQTWIKKMEMRKTSIKYN